MISTIDGTATIPLKEYHRLLECEDSLWKLREQPGTLLFHFGPYHETTWAVVNADEAMKTLVGKAELEIKDLRERLDRQAQQKEKKGWI